MYLLILPASIVRGCKSIFTFHNVSINSLSWSFSPVLLPDLHSIMYLLIRKVWSLDCLKSRNLHSIMYLLIQMKWRFRVFNIVLFTFHNVSINSILIHQPCFKFFLFTFHNVSINSVEDFDRLLNNLNLHSIMYLLIRCSNDNKRYVYCIYIP